MGRSRLDIARRGRHAVLLLLVIALLPRAAGGDDDPRRVIVQVNRHEEVMGYVHEEDEDVISVRTLDGKLTRFPKSRVLRIVHLVDPLPGQAGIVVLRNGQRRRGIVLEDSFDRVVLEIEGLRTSLRRESVEYVILEPTFEQRYAQYKAALRPNVPEEHLDLCRWLVDLRKYELARAELLELTAASRLPEAQQLLTLVEAQLALEAGRDAGPPPPEPVDDRPEPDDLPRRIISYDDVNLIRVYEIDFDRPPKVSIAPETIRALMEEYAGSRLLPATKSERLALFRGDPLEVAALMFELRARDYYPKIQVVSEPWALNLFRRRVHNAWLLNNCGTSRCHGGGDAGRFYLHRGHYKDPRVRYTNLLILQRLELDPQWRLINYEDPMMSLLIQYGLPRHLARKPHPDVRGWKPAFSGSGRMLQDTISWIESMMVPRPEYPVEFDPEPPAPDEEEEEAEPDWPTSIPGSPDGERTPR